LGGFEFDTGGVEGCGVAGNGGIVERGKLFCEEFSALAMVCSIMESSRSSL